MGHLSPMGHLSTVSARYFPAPYCKRIFYPHTVTVGTGVCVWLAIVYSRYRLRVASHLGIGYVWLAIVYSWYRLRVAGHSVFPV